MYTFKVLLKSTYCLDDIGRKSLSSALVSWWSTWPSTWANLFSHPRNKPLLSIQHSKYLSFFCLILLCFPLPCKTWPPFGFPRALELKESWISQRPRGAPSPAPCPCLPPSWEYTHGGTDSQLCETNACYFPCFLLCPYSAMATYSATCANNSPAQGVNMANSIANLRLKAKEYSLQRNQVPTVNWGKTIIKQA